MSHNLFQFIGNLTRDTDVRHSENSARAVFDLAVNRVWRNAAGAKQEQTDFFRIKSFGGLAENAGKYLGKGSKGVRPGPHRADEIREGRQDRIPGSISSPRESNTWTPKRQAAAKRPRPGHGRAVC